MKSVLLESIETNKKKENVFACGKGDSTVASAQEYKIISDIILSIATLDVPQLQPSYSRLDVICWSNSTYIAVAAAVSARPVAPAPQVWSAVSGGSTVFPL